VEAEAAAADTARQLRIEAVELLEDSLSLAGGNADALVADGEAYERVDSRDLDGDPAAAGRVLDRVLDEVEQHLPQLVFVAEHLGHVRRSLDRERDRGRCADPRERDDAFSERDDVAGPLGQAELAG